MKSLEVLQNEVLPDKILIFAKNVPEEASAKVDHMALLMNMIEVENNNLKKQEAELKAKRNKLEELIETAKLNIKEEMFSEGLCEIQGNLIKFSISNSNPKMIIEDEKSIPEKYRFETIVSNIDKEKIKEDLKLGKEVAGAKLEQGQTLKIGAVKI